MPLVLLVACAPEEPREVHVVTSRPEVPDGSTDTGSAPEEEAWEPAQACGGGDTGVPASALELEWCTRVTPEVPLDTGLPSDLEFLPPPCGFVNLVGAVGIAGDPDAPALLYCDGDADGGMRFVRTSPEEAGLQSTLLVALDCLPDAATGALVATDEGYLAVWSGSAGLGEVVTAPGVVTARLDTEGELVEGPTYIPAGGGASKLTLLDSLVFVNDADEALWAVPLDGGEAVQLATAARSLQAASFGGSPVVGLCSSDDTLRLLRLDAVGAVQSEVTLDATCGWTSRVSLAEGDEVLAVAWDDGVDGFLAFLDGEFAEIARVELGVGAEQGQLVWTGESFLLLTRDGALTRYASDGVAGETWWHPGLATADGSVVTTRLLHHEGRAAVALMGMDSYAVSTGHVNTFNYVEVSGFAVP